MDPLGSIPPQLRLAQAVSRSLEGRTLTAFVVEKLPQNHGYLLRIEGQLFKALADKPLIVGQSLRGRWLEGQFLAAEKPRADSFPTQFLSDPLSAPLDFMRLALGRTGLGARIDPHLLVKEYPFWTRDRIRARFFAELERKGLATKSLAQALEPLFAYEGEEGGRGGLDPQDGFNQGELSSRSRSQLALDLFNAWPQDSEWKAQPFRWDETEGLALFQVGAEGQIQRWNFHLRGQPEWFSLLPAGRPLSSSWHLIVYSPRELLPKIENFEGFLGPEGRVEFRPLAGFDGFEEGSLPGRELHA